MSSYSVDSLEPADCVSEIEESCNNNDEAKDHEADGRKRIIEESLSAIITSSSSRKILDSPASISKSLSQRSEHVLEKKFKNDKKLSNVLLPAIVDAKSKPKTYLELYRERTGIPTAPRVHSPEGSTLSTLGDTSYESIPDVDSRPVTSTPRDDQSELSFYRRLIQRQPRTTRSCETEQHLIEANDCMRSVSDCGLGANKRRLSYRPYSIGDYECLTVPLADRSLGPDPVEMRSKWEKLMRRTDYGDLASSRNRRNIVRHSELRKCKRTKIRKCIYVGLPLIEDSAIGAERIGGDSKNFRAATRDRETSSRIQTEAKNAPRQSRRCTNKQMLTVHPSNNPKNSSVKPNHVGVGLSVGPLSSRSSGETLDISSLEDLQRRHQNEKRVMDLLINRTLVR